MKLAAWVGFFLLLAALTGACSKTTEELSLSKEPAANLPTIQVNQIQATSEPSTASSATGVSDMGATSIAAVAIDPTAESLKQATVEITLPLLTPDVAIERDQATYRDGDPLLITIRNNLDLTIVSQTVDNCLGIAVEEQLAGRWQALDQCLHIGSDGVLTVEPDSAITWALIRDGQNQGSQDLQLGEPVAPAVFEGDLRTLPTITPSKPGDPTVEVPRGGSGKSTPAPESSPGTPEGSSSSPLEPGKYRIRLTFMAGAGSDQIYTVYSDEFIVSE